MSNPKRQRGSMTEFVLADASGYLQALSAAISSRHNNQTGDHNREHRQHHQQ